MSIKGQADTLAGVLDALDLVGDRAFLVVGGEHAADFQRYADDDGVGVVDVAPWIDFRVAPPSAFNSSQVNVAGGSVEFVAGVGWRVRNARVELEFLAAAGESDPIDIQLVCSVGGDTPVAADRLVWGLYRIDKLTSDIDYAWTMLRRSTANTIWQQTISVDGSNPSSASLVSNHTGIPTDVQLHAFQLRYGAGTAVGIRGNVTGASTGAPNTNATFVGPFGTEPVSTRAPYFQALTDPGSNIYFDIKGVLCHRKTRLEGL